MRIEIGSQLVTRLAYIADEFSMIVDAITAEIGEVPPETWARFADFKRENKCLNCGRGLANKDAKPIKRGVCISCYNLLIVLPNDRELVIEGRWRPPTRGGRPKKELGPLPELHPQARTTVETESVRDPESHPLEAISKLEHDVAESANEQTKENGHNS